MADQMVQPKFTVNGGGEIEIGLTRKPVSPWGGLALFASFGEAIGLRNIVKAPFTKYVSLAARQAGDWVDLGDGLAVAEAWIKRWRGSYPFHPTAERCWNRRLGSLFLNRRYRLMDVSSKAWPCFYPFCIPVHPVHPRQNQTLGASARPSPEVHHHPWLYLAGDEQDGRGCKTDKSRSCLAKPRLSKFELP